MKTHQTELDPFYRRGYLPHLDGGPRPVFVTFRLADALPAEVLERWRLELSGFERAESTRIIRNRVDRYLDTGHGSCLLERPECAEIVQEAMKFFDGERYSLHAWVVMLNHVHAGLTPLPGSDSQRS